MSTIAIYPTTLAGIKRLAHSIKIEQQIQHAKALDIAAMRAGFQHYRAALGALGNGPEEEVRVSERVFITAYWRDHEQRTSGRETLVAMLPAAWASLVSRSQMRYQRELRWFRGDAPDHLECVNDLGSQSNARAVVCAASRALQFMAATGLRPAYGKTLDRRDFPNWPGQDHVAYWVDPLTGHTLATDEPYGAPVDRLGPQRVAWAAQNAYAIHRVRWPGIYAPGFSTLDLVCVAANAEWMEVLVSRLDRLPMPAVESEWSGESTVYRPVFVSPGRAQSSARKKERKQADPLRRYNQSLGYVQVLGGATRRPDGRMTVSQHQEVGRLLKGVLAVSMDRRSVYNPVARVRYELDEWVQREYNAEELSNEVFRGLYYQDNLSQESAAQTLGAATLAQQLNALERVEQVLRMAYPDCAPLRELVRHIGVASNALKRWHQSGKARVA